MHTWPWVDQEFGVLAGGGAVGITLRRSGFAGTEVSSTAHLTSVRNALEQTKRPVSGLFSSREGHIVRMARGAGVFTVEGCCSYDSGRPVSKRGYGYGSSSRYFSEGPVV